MLSKITVLTLISFFLIQLTSYAANYNISGRVVDAETGNPIPGASLRVQKLKKGTYTSSNGKFRLPLPDGSHKISITSIGYSSKEIEVSGFRDSMLIELKSRPIAQKSVDITGEIDVNQIIQRAISRKNDNLTKIKTFKGLLYTKMIIELGGDMFESEISGDQGSVSIDMGPDKAPKEYQHFITETFSNVYIDREKDIEKKEIIQRRQTANIEPDQNLVSVGTFMDFSQNRIQIMNAEFATPLSDDAFDYYKFRLLERKVLDERYVYVIEVIPASAIYPTFRGTMKIVEGTYNLVELELQPSESTSLPWIQDASFRQRFDEFGDGIWYPVFLELTGRAEIDIIKGLMSITANLKISNIFNEASLNVPLPDSVYIKDIPLLTVAAKADSAKSEFWEENSLREISPMELEIYRKVDSMVVLRDSIKAEESGFKYSLFDPVIEFDRVQSIALGLAPSCSYNGLNFVTEAKYSFGQDRVYGSGALSWGISDSAGTFYLGLFAALFSRPSTFYNVHDYPVLYNTVSSALFHTDYYDYYLSDGWRGGISFSWMGVRISGQAEFIQQQSLAKTTNTSIFSDKLWRENPAINEGRYVRTILGLTYSRSSIFGLDGLDLSLVAEGALISYETNKEQNKSFDSKLSFAIPTFSTGYSKMMLNLTGRFGIGSDELPVQYQFAMPTGLLPFGSGDIFYSAPIASYGGIKYFSYHATFNLTDLWWRAIGIPLYEGRGMDLILGASAGRFINESSSFYLGTGAEYYYEAGFGLSRIPTFISNVIYLSFDARWGFGDIAKGRFGWGIGISLPF